MITSNAVIVEYARTPFTLANKGGLTKIRPDEMAGQLIKAILEKTKIAKEDVEDLILGCAFPEGEQGLNIGKIVSFASQMPESVSGVTVNRFCGSSMEAIHMAAGKIAMNSGDVFICAGVESMTRIPMGGFNPLPHPDLHKNYPEIYMSMGMTAENVATKYNISRQEQEQFAVNSHKKAANAVAKGLLANETIGIKDKNNNQIIQDDCIRPETSLEVLAGLKTAFLHDGSVTAGTSSPLTDGASVTIITSEAYAEKHGLTPLARIKSIASAGCRPELMGLGPIFATKKALMRSGLTAKDIDIFEINEAFSSQAIASIRDIGVDESKVNIDGGAIAIGHPLGATGARITGKAASLLKREGVKYAVATQCIGGGQGIATVLERI